MDMSLFMNVLIVIMIVAMIIAVIMIMTTWSCFIFFRYISNHAIGC